MLSNKCRELNTTEDTVLQKSQSHIFGTQKKRREGEPLHYSHYKRKEWQDNRHMGVDLRKNGRGEDYGSEMKKKRRMGRVNVISRVGGGGCQLGE
jgi:hypothetical protein